MNQPSVHGGRPPHRAGPSAAGLSAAMRRTGGALALALLLAPSPDVAVAQPRDGAVAPAAAGVEVTGLLANGTRYALYRPARWNGILILDPDLFTGPQSIADPLHALGYATGFRARNVTNWQVRAGATDLLQLKALFTDRFSAPETTMLTGSSLGGLVVRDAGETYPGAFQGVIPACGGGAGLISMYNLRLDIAFAVKTLLGADAPEIDISHIRNEARNAAAMKAVVERALRLPQGRARLALVAALGQIDGWAPAAPQPPDGEDVDSQLKAIADTAAGVLNLKSDVEKAAGGDFAWNVGVDYREVYALATPGAKRLAQRLYDQAGASLEADLALLQAAPRQRADAEAVAWARGNGTASGRLRLPTFALFTAVDPRQPLSEYRAYQKTVDRAGATALLRQAGVFRSGHCAFSPLERLTAVSVMAERLRTGRWPSVTPASLNARARQVQRELGGFAGDTKFAAFPDTPEHARWFAADSALPPGALNPPKP